MTLAKVKCSCGKVTTSNPNYLTAHDLHVGSSRNDVISAFYHDEKMTDYKVNDKVYGKFLYGRLTRDELFENKIKDDYHYSFINSYSKEPQNQSIEYVYLKAPYIGTYASKNDSCYRLLFTFENNIVSSITWEHCPKSNN